MSNVLYNNPWTYSRQFIHKFRIRSWHFPVTGTKGKIRISVNHGCSFHEQIFDLSSLSTCSSFPSWLPKRSCNQQDTMYLVKRVVLSPCQMLCTFMCIKRCQPWIKVATYKGISGLDISSKSQRGTCPIWNINIPC